MRLFALFALALASVSAQAETLGFSLLTDPAATQITVTVFDDESLQTVPGAEVKMGESFESSPAAGVSNNKGTTVFPLSTSTKVIQVSKPGYADFSLIGAQANKLAVFLKPIPVNARNVMASGTMGGFQPATGSSYVRAGVVIRTLSVFDALKFDIGSVISPLEDTIDVMGPRHIPSNIVLPKQKVSVIIGSIELNKPEYRLPVPNNRGVQFSAAQGEVTVGDLLSVGSGLKAAMLILNRTKIKRIGLDQPMGPPAGDFKRSFDGTIPVEPAHQVTVQKPPFPANVLVAPVLDLEGNRRTLVPTDVKVPIRDDGSMDSKPAFVSAPKEQIGKNRFLLTLALGDDRLSGIVTTGMAAKMSPGNYLPAPAITRNAPLPEKVQLSAPATGLGVLVLESRSPQDSQIVYPVSVVYTLPSAGVTAVPTKLLAEGLPVHGYSVNQLDFGNAFNEKSVDAQSQMMWLWRFARSQTKVK